MKKLLLLFLVLFPLISHGTILSFYGAEEQTVLESGTSQGTGGSYSTSWKNCGVASYRSNPVTTGMPRHHVGGFASTGGNSGFFTTSADTYYTGHIYIAACPSASMEPIADVVTSGVALKMRLTLGSDCKVGMYAAGTTLLASSTALTTGVKHVVKLRVGSNTGGSPSNNLYSLEIDGVDVGSGTSGTSLLNTGAARISLGKNANLASQGYDVYFDDWVVDDSAFQSENSCIETHDVNDDGSNTGWTSGDYTSVDEPAPYDADTTYIGILLPTYNIVSSFQMEDFASAYSSILGVSAHILSRDELGTSADFLYLKSGATVATTTQVDPTSVYIMTNKLFLTDPNTGSAWTNSAIDALEVGVGSGTGSTGANLRMTKASYQVLYIPPTASPTATPSKFPWWFDWFY